VEAALAQSARRFETGRSGADHEDTAPVGGGRDDLRMPAAAPFLAHGRILGAADRRVQRIVRVADVAADAFADFVEPAFLDLPWQEGIGDRRPRGADE